MIELDFGLRSIVLLSSGVAAALAAVALDQHRRWTERAERRAERAAAENISWLVPRPRPSLRAVGRTGRQLTEDELRMFDLARVIAKNDLDYNERKRHGRS